MIGRLLGAEAAHRVLEDPRATVGVESEGFAIEHDLVDGQPARSSDDER